MVTITESVDEEISVGDTNAPLSKERSSEEPGFKYECDPPVQDEKSYDPHNSFAVNPEFYYNSKPISEITHADIIDLTFDTVEEAEAFYNRHALAVGFSVRKNELKRNRQGEIIARRWVCYRQGLREGKWMEQNNRKKIQKAITRCNCEAAFKVSFRPSKKKWEVLHFNPTHNHNLTSKVHLHFLRSNRIVDSCDLAQAKSLKAVGIKTCQVMDAMVDQAGGFELVGYTKKDLQNKIDAEKRKMIGASDAMSAIAYLTARVESDPGFFCRYTVDEDNRLQNLYWCDSTSRRDYKAFGQAMAFDSTYKNNAYGKPLVIVCGVNHHYRTSVFCFALLADEKIETYEWLLVTFLEAMGGDSPNVVLTDGDLAMRQAIANVLPKSRHRLCSWHLLRNAEARIHDENFTAQFARCMLSNCTVEQFDSRWERLLTRFRVRDHPWTKRMSEEKEHWADAYFRGVFCAGMRTTSRNESMNNVIKKNLHERIKLYEFVRVLDRALASVRHVESKDDYDSTAGKIIPITHLKHYESQAASIYTNSVFQMIREELWDEGKLIQKECIDSAGVRVYRFKMFQKLREEWTVTFAPATVDIKCSCKGMESVGIPCCHAFSVMKAENLGEIPRQLILTRWTKDAKADEAPSQKLNELDGAQTRMARMAALSTICNRICFRASLDDAAYQTAKRELNQMSMTINAHLPSTQLGDPPRRTLPNLPEMVKDPIVANTKGAPKTRFKAKKRRACSKCKQTGHNAKTCKRKARARLYQTRTKRRKNHHEEDTVTDSTSTTSN